MPSPYHVSRASPDDNCAVRLTDPPFGFNGGGHPSQASLSKLVPQFLPVRSGASLAHFCVPILIFPAKPAIAFAGMSGKGP